MIAEMMVAQAVLHRELGHVRAAADLDRRALVLRQSVLSADDPALAESKVAVAENLLAAGDARGAVPLAQEALRVLEAVGGSSADRARWILARSLWTSGLDRDRAITVARELRAGLGSDGVSEATLGPEVDRWLERRSRP